MTITNAILLAAGFGTRLKPLTLTTPKPLLPLDGTTLIDHQLYYLANFGIKTVAINLHHLGEKIESHVGDGSKYGLSIKYSHEETILDTGGGIKKASMLLEKGPFLALNCDSLIAANIGKVVERHFELNSVATMVVKEISGGEDYKPLLLGKYHLLPNPPPSLRLCSGQAKRGGLSLETNPSKSRELFDELTFIKKIGTGRHFYAGVQVLSPEFLDALPPAGETFCLIKDGYIRAIESGKKIGAYLYDGYFNDLGTAQRYEKAKQDIKDNIFILQQK